MVLATPRSCFQETVTELTRLAQERVPVFEYKPYYGPSEQYLDRYFKAVYTHDPKRVSEWNRHLRDCAYVVDDGYGEGLERTYIQIQRQSIIAGMRFMQPEEWARVSLQNIHFILQESTQGQLGRQGTYLRGEISSQRDLVLTNLCLVVAAWLNGVPLHRGSWVLGEARPVGSAPLVGKVPWDTSVLLKSYAKGYGPILSMLSASSIQMRVQEVLSEIYATPPHYHEEKGFAEQLHRLLFVGDCMDWAALWRCRDLVPNWTDSLQDWKLLFANYLASDFFRFFAKKQYHVLLESPAGEFRTNAWGVKVQPALNRTPVHDSVTGEPILLRRFRDPDEVEKFRKGFKPLNEDTCNRLIVSACTVLIHLTTCYRAMGWARSQLNSWGLFRGARAYWDKSLGLPEYLPIYDWGSRGVPLCTNPERRHLQHIYYSAQALGLGEMLRYPRTITENIDAQLWREVLDGDYHQILPALAGNRIDFQIWYLRVKLSPFGNWDRPPREVATHAYCLLDPLVRAASSSYANITLEWMLELAKNVPMQLVRLLEGLQSVAEDTLDGVFRQLTTPEYMDHDGEWSDRTEIFDPISKALNEVDTLLNAIDGFDPMPVSRDGVDKVLYLLRQKLTAESAVFEEQYETRSFPDMTKLKDACKKYSWARLLTSPGELLEEGARMHHCVWNENYLQEGLEGVAVFFHIEPELLHFDDYAALAAEYERDGNNLHEGFSEILEMSEEDFDDIVTDACDDGYTASFLHRCVGRSQERKWVHSSSKGVGNHEIPSWLEILTHALLKVIQRELG